MKQIYLAIIMALLAGCGAEDQQGSLPGPSASQEAPNQELDDICNDVDRMIKANIQGVNRESLFRLESLADRQPDILAGQEAQAAACRIAGYHDTAWPVVEHGGRWYVLIDEGHPAADGFYAVVIIDQSTGEVLARIMDTTGNNPLVLPVSPSPSLPGGAMTIDLREDYPVVYGHIVQRVAGYDRKKNAGPGKAGDPVAAITCGYDHDQGGWVALVFDTRPGAEADGEWTNYIGDVSIAFPHWAAASDVLYDQGKSVNLILMDGSTQEILPESEEAVMGPCIGEVLRQAMLAARDNGVLQRLPLADHCLMGVEHLEGEYAWPIFENREDGLVK